jgi:hypothetical protein
LKIEVWADIVCPWCGLSNHRLDNGLDPSGAVLVRPDGFAGFRSINAADDEQKSLSSALREILDLS